MLHQTTIQTATRITRTIPAAIPAMTAMQIKIMKTKRKRNPQTHLLVRLLLYGRYRFPLSFLLRQRITTATVDYSCSSLAVTANPADSKASVTSVTGNDSLEVGENTVSVVVTAEDGSTSTYNIVVTRRAEDDPENADKQDNWKKFDINGTEWTMVNDIPEDVVPEGF